MQLIVANLVFSVGQVPPIWDVSPWLDQRTRTPEKGIHLLEAQMHRRFIKSHLPADGLPYFSNAKYIVVGRDGRDVFMSLWNHYRNYTDQAYKRLNDTPGRVGPPLPSCPEDIREFWSDWITRGWFDWECEGYPYWSNLRHLATWWRCGGLQNVMFVHYSDLLADLVGQIRLVADFLEFDTTEEEVAAIAQEVTFENVKQNADRLLPQATDSFKGGAKTFLHQGKNGRWKQVLTRSDLELYATAVRRELSEDCATWLEHGSLSKVRIISS